MKRKKEENEEVNDEEAKGEDVDSDGEAGVSDDEGVHNDINLGEYEAHGSTVNAICMA